MQTVPLEGEKTQVSHTYDLFNLLEERREELCEVNSQHSFGLPCFERVRGNNIGGGIRDLWYRNLRPCIQWKSEGHRFTSQIFISNEVQLKV